ncbi:MAG: hypothetical protein Q8P18_34405 [Pseudomonadota bacterium]|nr:hypothetical protein [Pseudomonadota bacterium]
MEDRRAFLRLAVFGLASSAVGSAAAVAAPGAPLLGAPVLGATGVSAGLAAATGVHQSPWWLIQPLQAGSAIGLGWHVARLYPAVQGAVTLNLLHEDGRTARVDLSLRIGAPRGPASSAYIDFIVMDGGDGASPMDESLGRAVVRLAAIVSDNEERDLDSLAALEPHDERMWRHADALAQAATRLVPG